MDAQNNKIGTDINSELSLIHNGFVALRATFDLSFWLYCHNTYSSMEYFKTNR